MTARKCSRRISSSLTLTCVALFFAAAAAAKTTTDGPMQVTRKTLEQARLIVASNGPHDTKLRRLSHLLRGFLDTDTMGRAALAGHWGAFAAAQQHEFLTLFRELFQRTYVQKLLFFDQPDFEYLGEERNGTSALVRTSIVTPRDDFAITYKMHAGAKGWRATDIRIEDLSLVTNFRRQLDRLLKKSSVGNVLDRMRRKYGTKKKQATP